MRPSSTPPVDRYDRQLLLERSGMNDPAQIGKHQQQEVQDLAEWECAQSDVQTPIGEKCNLSVEKIDGEFVVPQACAECALATQAVLERRQAFVDDRRAAAEKFGKDLDARASA